jgi:hypothetical protein
VVAVSVEITDWDKIVRKYGKTAADNALKRGLRAGTDSAADMVKGRIGNHVVTGFMRSSIKGDVQSPREGKTYAAIGSGVYYTRFVEEGTGIYGKGGKPIVARRARAMAWHPRTATGAPIKKGGKVVRRSVKGQRPVGMFKQTFALDRAKMVDAFVRGFRSSFFTG